MKLKRLLQKPDDEHKYDKADEEKKKQMGTKILILSCIIIISVMVIFKNSQTKKQLEENQYEFSQDSLMEHNEYYYNSMAFTIASEVQEGSSKDDITSLLLEFGYDKPDIEKMYDELGVDWEKHIFLNTENQYFKYLVNDGVISVDSASEDKQKTTDNELKDFIIE